jgi:exodeoxyribonuclease VII large subunit
MGRRWPLTEIVLAPTPVQGPDAVFGVRRGIDALNALGDIDVIIVARGGGSDEELSTFNEELIARAVFGSAVPVVSAVGHETDVTICDYVADRRAPTPSAAAEMVVPDRAHMAARISAVVASAMNQARNTASRDRALVLSAIARSDRALPDVARLRQRIDDLGRRALGAAASDQRHRHQRLDACNRQLEALDPQATLNRGYAVVHKGGAVVSSIAQISTGDALVIKVADGGFPASAGGRGTRRRLRGATQPRNGDKPEQEQGVQKALLF